MTDENPDDFRILVATDNHLGYAEKDPLRGNDSFVSFEEILRYAQDLNVDMLLLGGDLFHDNKPTRNTLQTCMRLLRHYCLGDSPIRFQVVSDTTDDDGPTVNYEDPNFNIAIPVFSIHGNHDDPTGLGYLSAMDLLSEARLVNYFGKNLNVDGITVTPLLLKKGSNKLALYGFGSIRDERLHRLFHTKKVKIHRPQEDADDWFNLMVLHQNRARHGETNYIPEKFLPSFLDLVVWGHEHECRITPEPTTGKCFISQPGSSVATSLCRGEAAQKNIGLLTIKSDRSFKIEKFPLETVRQFYIEDIILSKTNLNLSGNKASEKVKKYCEEKVNELLRRAESEHSENEKQPREPLIRLRVDYEDVNQTFPAHQFAQIFTNTVANSKDIVKFRRCRKGQPEVTDDEDEEERTQRLQHQLENFDISNYNAFKIVSDHFANSEDSRRKMMLLTTTGMGNAVQEFVDKEEKFATRDLVKFQLERTRKALKSRDVDADDIEDQVENFKLSKENSKEEASEIEGVMNDARQKSRNSNGGGLDDESDNVVSDMDVDELDDSTASARGRGRGRGRGGRARGARGSRARASAQPTRRGRGRAAAADNTLSRFITTTRKQVNVIDLDDDDDDVSSMRSFASTSSRSVAGNRKRPAASRSVTSYDSDDDSLSFTSTATRSSRTSTARSKRAVKYEDDDEDDI